VELGKGQIDEQSRNEKEMVVHTYDRVMDLGEYSLRYTILIISVEAVPSGAVDGQSSR
jgi:hypothetical protein